MGFFRRIIAIRIMTDLPVIYQTPYNLERRDIGIDIVAFDTKKCIITEVIQSKSYGENSNIDINNTSIKNFINKAREFKIHDPNINVVFLYNTTNASSNSSGLGKKVTERFERENIKIETGNANVSKFIKRVHVLKKPLMI